MNLNKLRDRAHKIAVEHGWWEDERSVAECLALIHSELSEALEADRNGRRIANENVLPDFWKEYQLQLKFEKDNKKQGLSNDSLNRSFKDAFEKNIKDTFEDELADVVIRCLDFCGEREISLDFPDDFSGKANKSWYVRQDIAITEKLCALHSVISWCYDTESLAVGVVSIIQSTLWIAESLNIDLLKHIELKMKYNELRP